MKVIIVTGGTAGHIYPALVIGKKLREKNYEVFFISDGRRDKEILENGFILYNIKGKGWNRGFGLKNLIKFLINWLKTFPQDLYYLKTISPDLIIGTGGYLSITFCILGKIKRKKILIQEQNLLPGLANRFLSLIADKVCISFAESKKYFFFSKNIILTGNPIREDILNISREEGLNYFGFSPNKFTILVFGGSQGAKKLNTIFVETVNLLSSLQDKIQIIHLTGEQHFPFVLQLYQGERDYLRVFPYLFSMGYAYRASDLVISRAGATSISEIIACGLPSILIPYPYASENHQKLNAEMLVKNNAGIMIEEKDLNGPMLAEEILYLFYHPEKREEISQNIKKLYIPKPAENLIRVVEELIC